MNINEIYELSIISILLIHRVWVINHWRLCLFTISFWSNKCSPHRFLSLCFLHSLKSFKHSLHLLCALWQLNGWARWHIGHCWALSEGLWGVAAALEVVNGVVLLCFLVHDDLKVAKRTVADFFLVVLDHLGFVLLGHHLSLNSFDNFVLLIEFGISLCFFLVSNFFLSSVLSQLLLIIFSLFLFWFLSKFLWCLSRCDLLWKLEHVHNSSIIFLKTSESLSCLVLNLLGIISIIQLGLFIGENRSLIILLMMMLLLRMWVMVLLLVRML